MTRAKAATIHLLISILVVCTALIIMISFMYPWQFFNAGGGRVLIYILTSVDIIIGPLLTFIVFKQGKKTLKFDLTVIALLQIAALVYGMFVILSSRPIFMALVNDRFNLVQANEIEDVHLAEAQYPEFSKRSWTGPIMAVTKLPMDADEQQLVIMTAIAGADMDKFPKYYHPYDDNAILSLIHAKPLQQLLDERPDDADEIQDFVKSQQRDMTDFVFLPLSTRRNFLTVILDKDDGSFIDILNIDPWF